MHAELGPEQEFHENGQLQPAAARRIVYVQTSGYDRHFSSYVSCLHNFKRNANITNRYESTECYVRGGDMNYEKRKKTEKGGYLHY